AEQRRLARPEGRLAVADAPPGRADRSREGAGGAEMTAGVDGERQLGERPAGRAEEHGAARGRVEGRVVAGADERRARLDRRKGGLAVEGDGTAGVGADLGVGEDAAGGPAVPA